MLYSRRIGLESTAAQSQVRPVLLNFPGAMTNLHNLVFRRGLINHVRDPCVPAPCQYNTSPATSKSETPTSRAQSARGRILSACNRPSEFGLATLSVIPGRDPRRRGILGSSWTHAGAHHACSRSTCFRIGQRQSKYRLWCHLGFESR